MTLAESVNVLGTCWAPNCGIPLVSQRAWPKLTDAEREGKRAHGGHGLCFLHWRRRRQHGTFDVRHPGRGERAVNFAVTKCSEALCTHKVASKGALKYKPELRKQGVKRRYGDGLCEACYHRRRRNSTAVAPASRTPSEQHEIILEEWEFLRDGGESVYAFADRMGLKIGTLHNILRDARRRGDRRGGLLPYGNDMRRSAA